MRPHEVPNGELHNSERITNPRPAKAGCGITHCALFISASHPPHFVFAPTDDGHDTNAERAVCPRWYWQSLSLFLWIFFLLTASAPKKLVPTAVSEAYKSSFLSLPLRMKQETQSCSINPASPIQPKDWICSNNTELLLYSAGVFAKGCISARNKPMQRFFLQRIQRDGMLEPTNRRYPSLWHPNHQLLTLAVVSLQYYTYWTHLNTDLVCFKTTMKAMNHRTAQELERNELSHIIDKTRLVFTACSENLCLLLL